MAITRPLAAPLFLFTSLVTACSDPAPPPRNVNDVLGAFGVDVSDTPRVDDDQQPLPDSFAPLGGRTTIGRFDELALFGIRLAIGIIRSGRL